MSFGFPIRLEGRLAINAKWPIAWTRPPLRVDVSEKDQAALKKLLAGGIEQVRVAMRAVALLRLGDLRVATRRRSTARSACFSSDR